MKTRRHRAPVLFAGCCMAGIAVFVIDAVQGDQAVMLAGMAWAFGSMTGAVTAQADGLNDRGGNYGGR